MTGKLKKSLSILSGEIQLQLVAVSVFACLFMLSFFGVRWFAGTPGNELPKMFVIMYSYAICFLLPWQTNVKGHLEPGYCRYHLSLPVHTWQLCVLPLFFRLVMIFSFCGLALLLYTLLFPDLGYYLNSGDMWYYLKCAIIIYLLLQAFAWSKDWIRNLYQYLVAALVFVIWLKPDLVHYAFEDLYFATMALLLIVLCCVGVAKMRVGQTFALPGIQSLCHCIPGRNRIKAIKFRGPVSAQFYHELKNSWLFMPLVTLVILVGVTLMQINSKYFLTNYSPHKDLTVIFLTYILIIFIVPMCGIIYINSRAFRSRYVDNLPVSSETLAQVKLWCFMLGTGLSLVCYFAWAGIKLWLHYNKIYSLILEGFPYFINDPLILVWLISGMLILSISAAFFIATLYMNYGWISGVCALGAFILVIKTSYNRSFMTSIDDNVYLLFSMMFILFITVKFALFLVAAKRWWLKVVLIFLAIPFSALYAGLSGHYVFLIIFPFVLCCVYLVMGLHKRFAVRRHELYLIRVPWKTALIVFAGYSVFALYVSTINLFQKSKLDAILNSCPREAVEVPGKIYSNAEIRAYIARNIPYPDQSMKCIDEYIKQSSKQISRSHCISYDVRRYMSNIIESKTDLKEFRSAFEFLLFWYKYSNKFFKQGASGLYRPSRLENIYLNYSPPAGKLRELLDQQRELIRKRLGAMDKNITSQLELFGSERPGVVLMDRLYVNRLRLNSPFFLSFPELYISPMVLKAQIRNATAMKSALLAVYYLTGRSNDKSVMNVAVDRRDAHVYIYYFGLNNLQIELIETASMLYRAKYGREPSSPDKLVPEFLHERELYVQNRYENWRSTHKRIFIPAAEAIAQRDEAMKRRRSIKKARRKKSGSSAQKR